VTPTTGDSTTSFEFSVTYTHSTGVSPESALVYVDGTPTPMELSSGSPSTGASYTSSMTLAEGTHEYFFVFYDGESYTADPPGPAYLTGPTVS
jgi:hypothetical protein